METKELDLKLDLAAESEHSWYVTLVRADPNSVRDAPEGGAEFRVTVGRVDAYEPSLESALNLAKDAAEASSEDGVVVAAFVSYGLVLAPAFLQTLSDSWEKAGIAMAAACEEEGHDHVICEDCAKAHGLVSA